jgi:hypothetical protein
MSTLASFPFSADISRIVPGGSMSPQGSVLPGDPYFQSPEYRALQERMGSGPQIGTADIYDSPYFGRFGSGSIGRQQDAAYKEYLARISATPTQPPSQGPGYMPPEVPVPGGSSANIIGNLPALRSGGGAEGSNIDPTLRPYLGMGLQRAEQLFFGQPQPQLFPGQMFVSPSQQTLDALAQQEQLSRAGSPQLMAAQEAFGRALGQTGFTAGGGFLGVNPFLQGAIASATRPVMQQFQEQTLPGIQSAFSAAGRYGSGAQTRAIGQAQEAASRAIGDISASMTAQDYARERALQQQSIGQQAVLGQMAPSFFAQQFLPSEQLAQIGASREAIAAKPLQEQISRFQFQQQLPYSQLQSYLSAVYGNPMASSAVPQQAPAQSNRLGTALGGAALGAGIGQMVGGNYGGFSSPLIGAGLGGLAGLLF